MNRRQFIQTASSVTILLANGKIVSAAEMGVAGWQLRKVVLRFVVASDGHYGLKDTNYQDFYSTLVSRVNEEHVKYPFAFCMINGDIIHDDKMFLLPAKQALDQLALPYYVSQGNHDHVSAEEWEATWKMPVNHDFSIKENSFLIATTSNEAGTYLCPDVNWISSKLQQYRRQKNIFIFLHINPGKQTMHGVDCPALFEAFTRYPNVRAVFNGHDHDEEGIKVKQQIPFIFDAHFGGNWGTSYRGFRIVELMEDNSIATYIMNPVDRINDAII